MKFGKSLRSEIGKTLPEWQGEFISYKELKKKLNLISPWQEVDQRFTKRQKLTTQNCFCTAERDETFGGEETGFISLLENELIKINTFFIDKEEECIIKLRELKEMVASMDNGGNTTEVKEDLLDFHGEMVLLLHYSLFNFAGLLKIVKKHNKKTGIMPTVPQQPFFATDLLYQLLRDCEKMLNQLFFASNP